MQLWRKHKNELKCMKKRTECVFAVFKWSVQIFQPVFFFGESINIYLSSCPPVIITFSGSCGYLWSEGGNQVPEILVLFRTCMNLNGEYSTADLASGHLFMMPSLQCFRKFDPEPTAEANWCLSLLSFTTIKVISDTVGWEQIFIYQMEENPKSNHWNSY